jgi:hypothetical protein
VTERPAFFDRTRPPPREMSVRVLETQQGTVPAERS